MSGTNPTEAARQPKAALAPSTTDLLKPRPSPFTRSVSDLQPGTGKLLSPLHTIATDTRERDKDKDRDKDRDKERERERARERERDKWQHQDDKLTPLASPFPYSSRTSADLPSAARSEFFSANATPDPCRTPNPAIIMAPKSDESSSAPLGQRKVSNEQKPLKDWHQMAKTVTGLKQCIFDLNETSSGTTQRLDKTYYSVLEKIGTLQSTILGLRELATQTQTTAEVFDKETGEVAKEVHNQLGQFGNFKSQEKRIEALRARIDVSREKMTALGGRIDVVKDRVEGWERADKEWQERTRKRLKTFWAATSIGLLVLVLLYLGAPYVVTLSEPPDPVGLIGTSAVCGASEGLGERTSDLTSTTSPAKRPEVDLGSHSPPEQRMPNLTRRSDVGGIDERLRVFDEL